MNMLTNMPIERRRAIRMGHAGRSQDWPSKVLHDVPQRMEPDGLDRGRLLALADFIAGLERAPHAEGLASKMGSDVHLCPAKFVDGRTKCEHFSLRDGGPNGFGQLFFKGRPDPQNVLGYALTGYGIVCWGWGRENGMRSVCLNGKVNEVSQVLAADPVLGSKTVSWTHGIITPRHVAQALRRYLDGMTPKEAWEAVKDRPWVVPPSALPKPVEAAKPEPKPVEVVKPAPKPKPVEVVSSHNDPVGIAHDAYLKAVALAERAAAAIEAAQAAFDAAQGRRRYG